jgi:hypothetical protein
MNDYRLLTSAVAIAAALIGCSTGESRLAPNDRDGGAKGDAGQNDAGQNDAAQNDAAQNDAGQNDAGHSDGGCITCWTDTDGDGYAAAGASPSAVCAPACGTRLTNRAPEVGARDCNDTDALIYPGAAERCNGVSDNCDVPVDEGATCPALSSCTGTLASARCRCQTTAFEVPLAGANFSCSGAGPLAVGGGVLCAIRANGSVSCWGGNPPAAAARFRQITLGSYFSAGPACGVTPGGTVQCWATRNDALKPVPTPPLGSNYLAASFGADLCAIDAAGKAVCLAGPSAPHPSGTRTYRQIVEGFGHTCALAQDGSVSCWGLGENSDTECVGVYACGQSAPLGGPFLQLAIGIVHSCGLRPTGVIDCWGAGRKPSEDGASMEWGQGRPRAVPFRYISAAGHATCGVRATDSSIECWGESYRNGAGNIASAPPGEYDIVAADTGFACGLTKSGDIKCWGNLVGANDAAIPASITGPFPLVP